ncbi:MAG: nicotinate-nucleotide adenylyltransferase [Acidimicrobiales bacterium]
MGVLGGTFDPVHNGHLAAAVSVRHQLGLDVVLMVVANQPWQKLPHRALAPAQDRLAVLRAGVKGLDGIEASDIEIEMGGLSYTADTLAELARRHPSAELFLIMGTDAAAGLDTWERPAEIRGLAQLVVVDRPGSPDRARQAVPKGWDARFVDIPGLDISSTEIRSRLRRGLRIDVLVPPAAIRCLARRAMYAGPG